VVGWTAVRSPRRRKWLGRCRRALRETAATGCLALVISSLVAWPLAAVGQPAPKSKSGSAGQKVNWKKRLGRNQKINQLLNRITFGPRPGDVERVRRMGIEAFLNQQLYPEQIDDSAVEARLAKLPTLTMTAEELVENYPQPQNVPKLEARQPDRLLRADGQNQPHADASPSGAQVGSASRVNAMTGSGMPETANQMVGASSSEMAGAGRKSSPAGNPNAQQGLGINGPQRVLMELAQKEVLRAVYSRRQLQEVMVQFWMNHFNVFAFKGSDKWLLTSFERDTIRPHALGKFEDLLVGTAQSPAMLFYLDNWQSAAPENVSRATPSSPGLAARKPLEVSFGGRRAPVPETARPQAAPPKFAPQSKRGLNENYGRELMELHTLGVDGGYTQKDVVEVARCLTGWTIDRPRQGGGFIFSPGMHDYGEKVVLGHTIRAGGGIEDGLEILHILAHQPATAHYISLKLCRRFVSDDPPAALVDRAERTFLDSDGDVRAVLKTILTSPEFYSQAAYRAKLKSPLELVASSIRALGADTDASAPLIYFVARMGQPMFQYQAPSGFADRAGTWINSGTLLVRLKYAMALASNRIRGTRINWSGIEAGNGGDSARAAVDRLNQQLLEGALTARTREAILKQVQSSDPPARPPQNTVATVAALVLASPEFQRR
jgi:uncharacterized protein (DUF1800 family)